IAGLVLFWYESLRIRERVIRVCRDLCERAELQLLDQSVALVSIRPVRPDGSRWQLRRIYRFEVSNNGADRHTGHITLLSGNVEAVQIDDVDGMSTIYPTLPGGLQ